MSDRVDTAPTSSPLPHPPGWPRPAGRLSRGLDGVLAVVVVGFFVLLTLGALGASPADLRDPSALAADLLALLRAGPVPWTGLVGVALVLLAPAVTAGARRPERERLVEDDGGRWILHFPVGAAGLWRDSLYTLGGTCLFLVWGADVVGAPVFFLVLVGVVSLYGTARVVLRAAVATWWPHRREGVDLTADGVERRTLRGVVQVPWSDVQEVEARARRRGEHGTRREIVLRLARPTELPRWSLGADRREVVVPADGFAVPGTRLYWACVACLDPARRAALLHGTELTAPSSR